VISEGLLKVAGSHRHCSGVICWKWCKIETLLLQTINRNWQAIAAISVLYSVLQLDSPIASLLKWDFSYSSTAIDKILIGKSLSAIAEHLAVFSRFSKNLP